MIQLLEMIHVSNEFKNSPSGNAVLVLAGSRFLMPFLNDLPGFCDYPLMQILSAHMFAEQNRITIKAIRFLLRKSKFSKCCFIQAVCINFV